MRKLKILGSIIIAVPILLLLISFFLPSTCVVQRSISINAPASTIYSQINNFQNWRKWAPWEQHDKTIKYTYNNIPQGVGAKQSWTSTQSGNGELAITQAEEPNLLVANMLFSDFNLHSTNTWTLKEQENKNTLLTWSNQAQLGYSPTMRYMGLFMENMMAPDFEIGLKNIKNISENAPQTNINQAPTHSDSTKNTITIMPNQIPPLTLLGIKVNCAPNQIYTKFTEAQTQIANYLKKINIQAAGPSMSIYNEYNDQKATFMVAIPIAEKVSGEKNINLIRIKGGNTLSCKYIGAYSGLQTIHETIKQHLKTNKIAQNGNPWEEYLIAPPAQPDSNKWETLVYYPIILK